ncbi:hypothetical protein PUN28_005413 [Cardiocondyla obscurior]|uniref:Uncharacterized protein n=1 Tax=Cardiocondyla obscurior TaxID=286306 RepID=A0AAW2GHD7_9HYME
MRAHWFPAGARNEDGATRWREERREGSHERARRNATGIKWRNEESGIGGIRRRLICVHTSELARVYTTVSSVLSRPLRPVAPDDASSSFPGTVSSARVHSRVRGGHTYALHFLDCVRVKFTRPLRLDPLARISARARARSTYALCTWCGRSDTPFPCCETLTVWARDKARLGEDESRVRRL